jgi:hypothetical protein
VGTSVTALTFDLDNKPDGPIIDGVQFVSWAGCRAIIGSSASSKPGCWRGRVVIEPTREMTAAELWLINGVITHRFGVQHPELVKDGKTAIDPACRKISQPYYFPQHSENVLVKGFYHLPLLDVDQFFATVAPHEHLNFARRQFQPRPQQQVDKSDEALAAAVACLDALDPDNEDDRFKSARVLYHAFGASAEVHWQNWYTRATNWSHEKARKKWDTDAQRLPAIPLSWLFRIKEQRDAINTTVAEWKKRKPDSAATAAAAMSA